MDEKTEAKEVKDLSCPMLLGLSGGRAGFEPGWLALRSLYLPPCDDPGARLLPS